MTKTEKQQAKKNVLRNVTGVIEYLNIALCPVDETKITFYIFE